MDKLFQDNYVDLLASLKEKIKLARYKAALSVNKELLIIYWEIGKTILSQQEEFGWGAKIIDKLSIDLKSEFPDFKGLSLRNLKYMRAFAEAYPNFGLVQQPVAQIENHENQHFTIVQPMVAQLSWTHHIVLLEKVKNIEERYFYMQKCVENGWSKNILSTQIETNLFKRQGGVINNFNQTLPNTNSDLAIETFKNPYIFDFISLTETIKERELENALIQHIKKFMLELGKGFAYVGNQYKLQVEEQDYFLDLLFYNYHLHCFIVFELKIDDFKPEYAGKLNFYINTIDSSIKGKEDKPTIGILLCKTPNETIVKYSLQGISTPMGVAEYELSQSLPKELKAEMPSIEELEAEIEKETERLQNPVEEKINRLKSLIDSLKSNEIKYHRKDIDTKELIIKYFSSIFGRIDEMLFDIKNLFVNTYYNININNKFSGDYQIDDVNNYLKDLVKNHKDEIWSISLSYQLKGLKKAGLKTLNYNNKILEIEFFEYKYSIKNSNSKVILEKLYHEEINKNEIEYVSNLCIEQLIEEITQQVENIKTE